MCFNRIIVSCLVFVHTDCLCLRCHYKMAPIHFNSIMRLNSKSHWSTADETNVSKPLPPLGVTNRLATSRPQSATISVNQSYGLLPCALWSRSCGSSEKDMLVFLRSARYASFIIGSGMSAAVNSDLNCKWNTINIEFNIFWYSGSWSGRQIQPNFTTLPSMNWCKNLFVKGPFILCDCDCVFFGRHNWITW